MHDAICDTSPVLYLHRIRLLALLPKLAARVVIPPAIIREIETGRGRGFDVPDVAAFPWVVVSKPSAIPARFISQDLGGGETEVIQLALENPGAVALLDDRAARDEAARQGIPVAGTLRILILFKQRNLITVVAPYIDELRSLGFRASDAAVEGALRLAGESTES